MIQVTLFYQQQIFKVLLLNLLSKNNEGQLKGSNEKHRSK